MVNIRPSILCGLEMPFRYIHQEDTDTVDGYQCQRRAPFVLLTNRPLRTLAVLHDSPRRQDSLGPLPRLVQTSERIPWDWRQTPRDTNTICSACLSCFDVSEDRFFDTRGAKRSLRSSKERAEIDHRPTVPPVPILRPGGIPAPDRSLFILPCLLERLIIDKIIEVFSFDLPPSRTDPISSLLL